MADESFQSTKIEKDRRKYWNIINIYLVGKSDDTQNSINY